MNFNISKFVCWKYNSLIFSAKSYDSEQHRSKHQVVANNTTSKAKTPEDTLKEINKLLSAGTLRLCNSKGDSCQAGPPGPPGPPGPRGEKGEQGRTGKRETPRKQRRQRPCGITRGKRQARYNGNCRAKGDSGLKGKKGDMGLAGVPGP